MYDAVWQRCTLGEVVTLQRGIDLPALHRRPGNVPVLGSFGVTGWHDQAAVPGPGVTVGRSGASIGVATYTDQDYWPLNTALYVKDFHGNYPRYAYYLLKSIDFRSYNSGSAQPSLNRNYIAHLPVLLPPPRVQRAIAEVLGALDDKIEANTRVSRLLDSLVRALYAEASASAEDEVPLEELVEPGLGGVWGEDAPGSDWDVRVRCLRGVDLARIVDGDASAAPLRWIARKPFESRTFADGEIWVEGSGSFCGRSLLVGSYLDRVYDDPVRNSNFVKRLVPQVSYGASCAAWLSMCAAYDAGEFAQWRTGSAFPNLDLAGLLRGHLVRIPQKPVLDRLAELTTLRLDPARMVETRSLADLRDALLSPLLSGELRLRDVEAMVGEAV